MVLNSHDIDYELAFERILYHKYNFKILDLSQSHFLVKHAFKIFMNHVIDFM